MKKRGLKRYYRNLSKNLLINKLDFSGGENSWFDFYHIHIDNTGLGNKSWKSRKQHLNALFATAEKIEENLIIYPNDFQYWIEISENNSFDDSIYIHTLNPNQKNFPTKINFNEAHKPNNKKLFEFISGKDYEIYNNMLHYDNDESELTYFLCKKDFGISIL